MVVHRVERHIINANHKLYAMIDEYCFKSKNLYNKANYILRQQFFNDGKIYNYQQMDSDFKPWDEYKQMMAQSSQQTLKLLSDNWKSFFKAMKKYAEDSSKFKGKPKPPHYKKSDGRFVAKFTNQNCKKIDGYIRFPRVFKKFCLATKIDGRLKEVRMIPDSNKRYILEIVYEKVIADKKDENERCMGIDLGLNNLATISSNVMSSVIINGKGLKSINQFYNKTIAHYQSIAEKVNNTYRTKRLNRITNKRNNKINDYIHKASRKIVDMCVDNNINTVIIGYNEEWKDEINIGSVNNQNFVSIPFLEFVKKIEYKAEEYGISVIRTEESYTSGTSFLDNELPNKDFYNKSRRIKRGLFKSNSGRLINADVNASLQIIKKVAPNTFSYGVEDLVLNPIKLCF